MNEEKGGNYDYDKQNIFICHATCRHGRYNATLCEYLDSIPVFVGLD
jgi:hypothetical protein